MVKFTKQTKIAWTRYVEQSSPQGHIDYCVMVWKEKLIPEEEWVHIFFQTLEIVPTNWYVQQELRCSTGTWSRLVDYFLDTFSFESEDFLLDCAL